MPFWALWAKKMPNAKKFSAKRQKANLELWGGGGAGYYGSPGIHQDTPWQVWGVRATPSGLGGRGSNFTFTPS